MKSDKVVELANKLWLPITENGKLEGFVAIDSIVFIRRAGEEVMISCSDKSKVFLSESVKSIQLKLKGQDR